MADVRVCAIERCPAGTSPIACSPFADKEVGVAAKELGETLYIEKVGLLRTGHDLPDEADQLIAILVASRRTAQSR